MIGITTLIAFLEVAAVVIIYMMIEWFAYSIMIPSWVKWGEKEKVALSSARSITDFVKLLSVIAIGIIIIEYLFL